VVEILGPQRKPEPEPDMKKPTRNMIKWNREDEPRSGREVKFA
jgi:hypothetical protein